MHRDWRIWVGVILMLAAMALYLMSNDLARWNTQRGNAPAFRSAGKLAGHPPAFYGSTKDTAANF